MIYACCDERRREAVRASALNGIDYLEVSADQRTLEVHLFHAAPGFGKQHVRIEGGERERHFGILSVDPDLADPRLYRVALDRYGDFSRYTLRLTENDGPLPQYDPRLSEVEFSFKVDCPSDFDCRTEESCPSEPTPTPEIDYLARDYATFRRLILDRLTQRVPGWRERSAADLGVTLAELIAYVGDLLSYQQDAIATEAYLGTARLRTSLRRHALLVDYTMHDGCNARTWVHVQLTEPDDPDDDVVLVLPREGTRFYTRVPGVTRLVAPDSTADETAQLANPVVFEPLEGATLHSRHNRIEFYTWGDRRCCLPKGATRATLAGRYEHLQPGDVLLFEEVVGPETNDAADADPRHRQVVRLVSVDFDRTDPLNGQPITEIAWADEDRLTFPLCISAVVGAGEDQVEVDSVSVARGNLVLADHGQSLDSQMLGTVPESRLRTPAAATCSCESSDSTPIAPRYRPRLPDAPLTFTSYVFVTETSGSSSREVPVPFDRRGPAAGAIPKSVVNTQPAILELTGELDGVESTWESRGDLLSSAGDDRHFVVEVEHDGSARLRFGDGTHGRRPDSGTEFSIRYRVGNGQAGNIGAESLYHLVGADISTVALIRNPLPASGGTDMEDDERVRRAAPQAFNRQKRAVTPADYAEVTQGHAGVQRAAATLRWTGSWHTVFVTVDRLGGVPMSDDFERDLTRRVDQYRMAGHDTEFDDPIRVSLEIDLTVCVQSDYFRSDVAAGLYEVLGSRALADGRTGIFHPDRLTFGQTVYLSSLYAAARQVAGVGSAVATVFQRQGYPDPKPLADGYLPMGRLEIPRLDNDPNYPEHGVLRLHLFGGK